jgi:alanyl-tRNA synthetase
MKGELGCGRNLILLEYENFCKEKGILFQIEKSVKSYDDTTFFCPAGMQQFKSKFKDLDHKGTLSNIQPCIRLNDLDEIGDGTHLLYFNMIGFFSFREKTLQDVIQFWMEFLTRIGIKPDYVTIHPDKVSEWNKYYTQYNFPIKWDDQCKWTDGDIGGYCTEFYKDGIEIGNIVNPLGDCIDVGFGLERLEMVLGNSRNSREETLRETVLKIIESGFKPSHTGGGYILRKLLRTLYKDGIKLDHPLYEDEVLRQQKNILKYEKLKEKNKYKSKEYWWETHGIDLDLIL